MTSLMRAAVSKKKIRYREDGFDLDLTYITPYIIAMGFPSEKVEGLYRNPISEVIKFYEKKHKDEYKLYNLCAERDYDHAKFHNRVSHYPFEDHNAPPVQLIVDCCKDIETWLKGGENRVVGINCKAGKGRTGLIICCYLMHSGIVATADEAMTYYGTRRTKDGKGVTIASQQRYVRYYEQVLKTGVPEPRLLKLTKVRVHTIPNFDGNPFITAVQKNQEVFTSKPQPIPKKATSYDIDCEVPLYGDIKIQLSNKARGSQKLCHFWFNTGFIDAETNTGSFLKFEIDTANKDRKHAFFDKDFKIELFFEAVNDLQKKHRKKKDKKKDKSEKNDNGENGDDVEKTEKTEKSDSEKTEKKSDKKSDKKKKGVVVVDAPEEPKDEPVEATADEPEKPKEEFVKKRNRTQSFYAENIDPSDSELSEEALEQKEMESYFQVEADEDGTQSSPGSTVVSSSKKSKKDKSDSESKKDRKESDSSEKSGKQESTSDGVKEENGHSKSKKKKSKSTEDE